MIIIIGMDKDKPVLDIQDKNKTNNYRNRISLFCGHLDKTGTLVTDVGEEG